MSTHVEKMFTELGAAIYLDRPRPTTSNGRGHAVTYGVYAHGHALEITIAPHASAQTPAEIITALRDELAVARSALTNIVAMPAEAPTLASHALAYLNGERYEPEDRDH